MPKSESQTNKKTEPQSRRRVQSKNSSTSAQTAETDGLSALRETHVGGDFSQATFERHAALLGDPRMSHSMYAQQRATVVRQLQRDYGNRYVQRLVKHVSRMRAEAVQAKLTVGPAGDKYEQEADRVANQVMETVSSPGQGAAQRQAPEEKELQMKPLVQRADLEEEELQMKPLAQRADLEEEELQMKPVAQRQVGLEGGDVGPEAAQSIQQTQGRGQALPDSLRTSMEGAFGADFSGVRVHSDAESDSLNEGLSARAFTTGQDVFIRREDYSPDSTAGQELIAHELTHVVQQGGGQLQRLRPKRGEKDADGMDARALDLKGTGQALRAPQRISTNVVQRIGKGRRKDIGDPLVVKVIIAGSGYDKWATQIEPVVGKRKVKETKKDVKTSADDPTRHERDNDPERPQVSFAGPGAPTSKYDYIWGGVQEMGPSSTSGLRDIGSNSIKNLVDTVPGVIKDMVTDLRKTYPQRPIVIMIKAHSRGAVAASIVAKNLKKSVGDANAKVELVLFDPVPGPRQSAEKHKIDLTGLEEFTIVYSVASGYPAGFTPQTVLGAKRIIISSQDHSAGLKVGFRYGTPLKTYKGSRLNSLPPGVYVDMNKNGENTVPLRLVDKIKPAQKALKEAYEGRTVQESYKTDWKDTDREARIDKVLKDWFKRNP